MRTVFATVALGTTMLVAASASAGESRHGWYIGLDVGLSSIEQASLNTPAYNALEFVDSGAALGVLGFAFDNHFRLEVEAGYRANDLDKVNGITVNKGELTEWSGMANLRYDVPIAD